MRKAFLMFFAFCLLISACATTTVPAPMATQTPSQTSTPVRKLYFAWTFSFTPEPSKTLPPSPTFTPSLTSTLQPPLIAHKWFPEWVLASFEIHWGDGSPPYPQTPRFILYADGNLFITTFDHGYNQLLHKKLSREEICQHLNTLDQIGFLDYDPSSYNFKDGRSSIMGGETVQITVNSWKENSGKFYSLFSYLQHELEGNPLDRDRLVIPSSLRNTYYYLSDYPLKWLSVYKPDRLVLWIQKRNRKQIDGGQITKALGPWPFAEMPLQYLFAEAGSPEFPNYEQYIIVEGEQAAHIYEFFNESYYSYGELVYEFAGDGQKEFYEVFARPLLPYEMPDLYYSEIPAPGTFNPNFSLTCYPSDGILPIPTPPSR